MTPRAPLRARGQILILALVFLAIFLSVAISLVGYLTDYARSERVSIASAQALALAEAGLDEAAYQLNQNVSYAGESGTALGAGTFSVTVASVDSSTKRVTATGFVPSSQHPTAIKTITAEVGLNASSISFHYGIQAGNGGFSLSNSSQIIGNVFSGGPVVGSGNVIYGDVVSSGTNGLVYGVHATSSVYAHTIGSASAATTVDGNAYYVNKTNATVAGTLYTNSPDQGTAALPISDAQISQWESYAEAGGTISSCDFSGNYTISSSMSLGPKKIACNLVIKSSSGVLTVTGPLWVTGNITTQTGPTIKMDSALGSTNVAIIADKPTNTTGSGVITVGQSTVFQGSGAQGSFVFLISQNNSAEAGGAVVALSLNQGASALVAYASHGLASLSQSVNVKEVTAYKIALTQSASVTYDTGLPNTIFQSGPGGSWDFVPGTYAIAR
ncbi:hypothetical protein HY091_01710 [Candidatus Kaiserbacteria bacterium]|nr:hypothetical protein [Candidatus Kaiserbacteria bacterium]